jgi:hypothetical protein
MTSSLTPSIGRSIRAEPNAHAAQIGSGNVQWIVLRLAGGDARAVYRYSIDLRPREKPTGDRTPQLFGVPRGETRG